MGELTYKENGEIWSTADEPHVARRRAIGKAHPEVKKLYGHCPWTKYITFAMVIAHTATAWALTVYKPHWSVFILVSFVIGATLTHALFLAIHEISHNLAAKSNSANFVLGWIANLPICIPYSVAFKFYHLEHHNDQGRDQIDTDIPTRWEAKVFRGKIGKALFVMFMIAFYAFRPMFIKFFPVNWWLVGNWIVCLTYDIALAYNLGVTPFIYFLLSAIFAGSIHPVSGHFISEHYVFKEGQETYSYYGPLNWLAFNVGYHNEHHDFLNIPGSRLPALTKMAPEFYNNLVQTKSWPGTIWDFIMLDHITCNSRIRREAYANE